MFAIGKQGFSQQEKHENKLFCVVLYSNWKTQTERKYFAFNLVITQAHCTGT